MRPRTGSASRFNRRIKSPTRSRSPASLPSRSKAATSRCRSRSPTRPRSRLAVRSRWTAAASRSTSSALRSAACSTCRNCRWSAGSPASTSCASTSWGSSTPTRYSPPAARNCSSMCRRCSLPASLRRIPPQPHSPNPASPCWPCSAIAKRHRHGRLSGRTMPLPVSTHRRRRARRAVPGADHPPRLICTSRSAPSAAEGRRRYRSQTARINWCSFTSMAPHQAGLAGADIPRQRRLAEPAGGICPTLSDVGFTGGCSPVRGAGPASPAAYAAWQRHQLHRRAQAGQFGLQHGGFSNQTPTLVFLFA